MNSKCLETVRLKGTLEEVDHMVCPWFAALQSPLTDETPAYF